MPQIKLSLFMMNKSARKRIVYDTPAIYQIKVNGRIDLTWSDCLEGMKIHLASVDAAPPVTILEGELRDQASLVGVINTVFELHLPLISVIRLDGPAPAEQIQSGEFGE